MNLIVLLLTSVVAFIVTSFVLPRLIYKIVQRGITGKDMNKPGKPEIPEMGGIAVLFGFWFAIMFSLLVYSYTDYLKELNLAALLAGFATITIIAYIGVIDDILGWKKGIRQIHKTLLPLVAALPLMALPETIAFTKMIVPFLGEVEFGILYPLIIVPIAVTGASNAVNMLAGFNGLEAGLGLIIALTFLGIAVTNDPFSRVESIIILLALIGTLIAFLRYNWFPAKVFPGDSLTFLIGASFATVAIIGNMEKIGLMLFGIYFVELFYKAKHRFKSECFGIPQKDGTLKANPKGGSLTQLIMSHRRLTEKQVVLIILGLQAVLSLIVFILSSYKLL